MTFLPEFRLGWSNAWVYLLVFYASFGILLWRFPSDVVRRLYDRTGWTPAMVQLARWARLFGVANIVLLLLTPLAWGRPPLYAGTVMFILGMILFIAALLDFRRTPQDQVITRGLYRFSRNPQAVGLLLALLGVAVATGTWLTVLLWAIMALLMHRRILAEETSCYLLYGESYADYKARTARYCGLSRTS
jgi:protein-S-isoprenylcysteine O-methyltransferase Ste14